ncbi:MAG TPA: nucleotidyltransferase family protein [Rhizomicrobium sp.]|nr:nucleotidyltransferase family protein [Rhizomicrobium sp.]
MNAVTRIDDQAAPGLFPTRQQMLVLEAALSPAEPALAAFRKWVGLIDLDAEFEYDTFRLLPLMYDNLRRHGVRHPLMARLKGIYRQTWYKNNKLFSDLAPVLEALHAAKIPVLLLKGVPLIEQYYRNIALRPMADIDVLVAPARAREAIELMTPFAYQRIAVPSPDFLKYRHAMGYWSPNNGEFDLHWHALYECQGASADDFFWNRARPLRFAGLDSLAPDATGLLLHTVIHGFRWNPEPPIRWIPDALTILRTAGGEIDWDAMTDYANAEALNHRLRLPLQFLQQRFAAPIPDAVLTRLSRRRTSLVQRIENSCVLRDPRGLHANPLGHLWIVFADYCRFARKANPVSFAIGFTHYLRFRWELPGRLAIPAYVTRGLFKRVRRWLPLRAQQPGLEKAPQALD